jgi:integrase/recombinase XerD
LEDPETAPPQKNGKEDHKTTPRLDGGLKCPECMGQSLYRDGLRYLADGTAVQRYLCRGCGYRFSYPKGKSFMSLDVFRHVDRIHTPSLYSPSPLSFSRQGSGDASSGAPSALKAVKTLATVEAGRESAAREGTQQTADIKGKIVEFLWHLKKNGVKGITLKSYSSILKRLANKTDLTPENVKEYLAKTSQWSDSTKSLCVIVYGSFLKYMGLSWQPPHYKAAEKMPNIPTEADIDQLISGSGRKLSTFLQFLKETGVRSGEAAGLRWSDIDFERRIVRITPEKGSKSRILPLSNKLINMLNNLPRNSDKVWATLYSLKSNFYKTRKSLAFKLQNPKLKQIGLHTFRHWKATMEYHKTKDILHVQQLLGHRDLRNTLIYINLEKALFQNVNDEFHVKVAHSLDEACKLLEVGFEYVTDMEGAKIFRKRK